MLYFEENFDLNEIKVVNNSKTTVATSLMKNKGT